MTLERAPLCTLSVNKQPEDTMAVEFLLLRSKGLPPGMGEVVLISRKVE